MAHTHTAKRTPIHQWIAFVLAQVRKELSIDLLDPHGQKLNSNRRTGHAHPTHCLFTNAINIWQIKKRAKLSWRSQGRQKKKIGLKLALKGQLLLLPIGGRIKAGTASGVGQLEENSFSRICRLTRIYVNLFRKTF